MSIEIIGSVQEILRSEEHVRLQGSFAITVGIVFASSESTIAETVQSLVEQRNAPVFELLLVSNGTKDDSIRIAVEAGQGLPIRVIACESAGYDANARNVTLVESSSDKLIYIDSDDVADPSYVTIMSDALDQYPLVTGVWSLTRLNAKIFPNIQNVIPLEKESWPFKEEGWHYAPTGTLGMRRSSLRSVGGFRPELWGSCNNEWCFRAYSKGFRIFAVLSAVQHYRLRRTIVGLFKQRYLWGFYDVIARKEAMSYGLPKRQLKDAMGSTTYRRLLKRAIKARTRWDLYQFVGDLGMALGHFGGSIRYGIFDL